MDGLGGIGFAGPLVWSLIHGFTKVDSPFFSVVKPALSNAEQAQLTAVTSAFLQTKPTQGLTNVDGSLRNVGRTYLQFACPSCARNLASFNGDKLADLLFAGDTTQIWVATSTGSGIYGPDTGLWADAGQFGGNQFYYLPGDFNRDGKMDLAIRRSNTSLDVTLSTGSGFFGAGSGTWAAAGAVGTNDGRYFAGDFNGDGLDDVLFFNNVDNTVWVSLSYGSGFLPKQRWETNGFGKFEGRHMVGDFNGDGLTDLGYFNPTDNSLQVSLSSGGFFGAAGSGTWINPGSFGHMNGMHYAGDFNGDGYTDLGFLEPQNQTFHVALSNGAGFSYSGVWLQDKRYSLPHRLFPADYNGDGKVDLGYSSASDGFFAAYSTGSSLAAQGDGRWFYYNDYGDMSWGRYYTGPTR